MEKRKAASRLLQSCGGRIGRLEELRDRLEPEVNTTKNPDFVPLLESNYISEYITLSGHTTTVVRYLSIPFFLNSASRAYACLTDHPAISSYISLSL